MVRRARARRAEGIVGGRRRPGRAARARAAQANCVRAPTPFRPRRPTPSPRAPRTTLLHTIPGMRRPATQRRGTRTLSRAP